MAVRLEVTPPGGGNAKAEPLVYGFDQPRITVGRAASADVRLPSRTVSEAHAVLRLEDGSYVVVDHGSTNGTSHNGQLLVAGRRKLLREGDRIEICGYRIVFRASAAMEPATSQERTAGLARRIVREALGVLPASGAAPAVRVLAGPDAGRRQELPAPPSSVSVGRDEGCALVLTDADVSRKHLELVRDWDGVLVRDLGSKNGISINGRRVSERRLRDRDEIALAATVLAFEDPADAYLRELETGPDEPMGESPAAAASEPSPPAAAPASEPRPDALAPAPEAAAPQSDARRAAAAPPPRRRRGSTGRSLADLAVFLLAAVVLVGSVAALVVLLRAG